DPPERQRRARHRIASLGDRRARGLRLLRLHRRSLARRHRRHQPLGGHRRGLLRAGQPGARGPWAPADRLCRPAPLPAGGARSRARALGRARDHQRRAAVPRRPRRRRLADRAGLRRGRRLEPGRRTRRARLRSAGRSRPRDMAARFVGLVYLPARKGLARSCMLLCLVACVDPPRATDDTDKTPSKPAPVAPTDPAFADEPVSSSTLAGGLLIEDFVIGHGDEAQVGSEVSVHYTGYLDDGTVFDTSHKRNRPHEFTIGEGRVIKGWDLGIPGMKVGGKRRLTIPAELAYGPRQRNKIPPNSRLTFHL